MTTIATRSPVDPREAQFGIRVGDPLVVDVDGHGSGWTIVAVRQHTYDLYANGRDLLGVPHADVYVTR